MVGASLLSMDSVEDWWNLPKRSIVWEVSVGIKASNGRLNQRSCGISGEELQLTSDTYEPIPKRDTDGSACECTVPVSMMLSTLLFVG